MKRRKTTSSTQIKFSSTGALKSLPLENRFLQDDMCSKEDFILSAHSFVSTTQKIVPLQHSTLQRSTESLHSISSQESLHHQTQTHAAAHQTQSHASAHLTQTHASTPQTQTHTATKSRFKSSQSE